jgi:proline racemase
MKSSSLKLFNVNCGGEIGDVVVRGDINLKGNTLLEQSRYLLNEGSLRNFLLNEPRGGVFKHVNLLVPPIKKQAAIGFLIMEPEDNPPMSGSNSICVATVVLERKIIPMKEPITEFTMEAPGGLVRVIAECKKGKVNNICIENLPSFVDKLDTIIEVEGIGTLKVDTAFGGDSYVILNAKDIGLSIIPNQAKDIVSVSIKIIKAANEQINFCHPTLDSLNYISFCQLLEPIHVNEQGIKEGKNTVCIRPGKLDRSPCGTGSSARLSLMRARNQININEKFISKSIINSKFICEIIKEYSYNNINYIKPTIKGSAFISGEQELYIDDSDPFPEGYKLNDTWPKNN